MTQYPVRTIDLAVLRENVRCIRRALKSHTQLMAVVKADAYGHGIVQVARNALHAGADWLAVARADEGRILRETGVKAPILVLGAATEAEIRDSVRNDLTLAATDPGMIFAIQHWAAQEGLVAQVHMKLDTGMGRIGARTEAEVRDMLYALAACPEVKLTGVFTHFADADGTDDSYTMQQLERFKLLTVILPKDVVRHCANSAALHRYPEAEMDMVRAGISMYGYPPVQNTMPLKPVMDWRTAVTYVKDARPGDKISYGCTFTVERGMTIATVACGYGDGYHRCASGKAQVLIQGVRCPVVGRICMDQMMVDVSALPNVKPGDEVILMGGEGASAITAEVLGNWSSTISYEVLLAATDRVYRRWINDCDE